MSAEQDLAPCPFCGGAPTEVKDGAGWPMVSCKCGASLESLKADHDPVTAWNRRPTPSPSAAEQAVVVPEWLSGKPYYCADCGAGGSERMGCEEPYCRTESASDAAARRVRHQEKSDSVPAGAGPITPGLPPSSAWHVEYDGGYAVLDQEGDLVAIGMATAQQARLISAAPDLLAALKAMVNRWEPAPDGHADRRMWEDAGGAINKAEGRVATEGQGRSKAEHAPTAEVLEEILHATTKEAPKGPQAYAWGWQDAMQEIRGQVQRCASGLGDGVVREVAAGAKVDWRSEDAPNSPSRLGEAVEAARKWMIDSSGIPLSNDDAFIICRALLSVRDVTIEECARIVESESYRDEHGERAAEIIRSLSEGKGERE